MLGYTYKRYITLLIISIILIGCKARKTELECTSDDDCGIGGCSGQICGPKERVSDIITTCQWLPEYGCYKKTRCACINGKCKWEETKEFLECLKAIK